MTASIPPNICPFCGLATAVPHETQAGCIAALHAEIAQMRELLSHVKDPLARPRPNEDAEVT
jgi:coproporphyrinogen III oxidase-like Fe-S oxidoreductase